MYIYIYVVVLIMTNQSEWYWIRLIYLSVNTDTSRILIKQETYTRNQSHLSCVLCNTASREVNGEWCICIRAMWNATWYAVIEWTQNANEVRLDGAREKFFRSEYLYPLGFFWVKWVSSKKWWPARIFCFDGRHTQLDRIRHWTQWRRLDQRQINSS